MPRSGELRVQWSLRDPMAFTLPQFESARPYLFHLTAREHLGALTDARQLVPASLMLEAANAARWHREKRRNHVRIRVSGRDIDLRDQKPLHQGNVALAAGWTFEDLLAHLNRRVFFWPGRSSGQPIAYGVRHFERYASERPAILRVCTTDLFTLNQHVVPEFCKYNSGSPRCTNGRPSPRGPDTFLPCDEAPFTAGSVVEVTFPAPIRLPDSTQVGDSINGPWRLL